MNNLPELPDLVKTEFVADLFDVKLATVRDWIHKGHIKGRRINGYWRVERQSVIDFANERFGS